MPNLINKLEAYGELQKNTKYRIVTLHPLSDELDLLEKLEMAPNECKSCDLYWLFNDIMFFVSIMCLDDQKPLVTYHVKENMDDGHSFYVITNSFVLSSKGIERTLDCLSSWVDSNNKIIKDITVTKLKISSNDIVNYRTLG